MAVFARIRIQDDIMVVVVETFHAEVSNVSVVYTNG